MITCRCADGFTGEQCNVVIVVVDGDDDGDDDDISATDIILISVFVTLLVVLDAVIAFYIVYRNQRQAFDASS